jgi:voltage-gated potassium channel
LRSRIDTVTWKDGQWLRQGVNTVSERDGDGRLSVGIALYSSNLDWPEVTRVQDQHAQVVEGESGSRPEKVPLTARLLLRESLTARRAAGIIAAFTVLVTVAGGVMERVIDHSEFPTIGRGLWFALQTVTTVGYGDVTPKQAAGRFIGAVVMLAGIGFLAVITASVTASLVESSRRRFAAQSDLEATQRLEEVSDRLVRIETVLDQLVARRPGDGVR